MGSEGIFVLALFGPVIMLYLVVRCFNKKSRPYAVSILIASLAVTFYCSKRPTAYYWDFFLFFTASSILFSSIAFVIKGGMESISSTENKNALDIRIAVILILGCISVYGVNKILNS